MAVTDWKAPGTCANVARPFGESDWSNVDNAKASNDAYVSSFIVINHFTHWLRCTNFGFTTDDIPSGMSIIGIEVKIEKKANIASGVADSALYLRTSVEQKGSNKADGVTVWSNTDTEITYGASDDSWDSGLSDSDVRGSDFGIDFSAFASFSFRAAYVDCISVRIYYGYKEILRPNATGDETHIPREYPVDGDHWDYVNNSPPDEDEYIYTSYTDSLLYLRDLYKLPAHSVGAGTINYIKIYFRATYGGSQGYAKPSLKSDDIVTDGTEVASDTAYATYSERWDNNPTGGAWAWADIDALQIGVSLRATSGGSVACNQVYVEINCEEVVGAVTVGRLVYGGLVNSGLIGGRLTG